MTDSLYISSPGSRNKNIQNIIYSHILRNADLSKYEVKVKKIFSSAVYLKVIDIYKYNHVP